STCGVGDRRNVLLADRVKRLVVQAADIHGYADKRCRRVELHEFGLQVEAMWHLGQPPARGRRWAPDHRRSQTLTIFGLIGAPAPRRPLFLAPAATAIAAAAAGVGLAA